MVDNSGKDFRVNLRNFRKNIFLIALGIVIGISGVLISQYFKGPRQTVSVVGYGEIDAPMDSANINVIVTNSSPNQQQADADNKQAVEKIKNQLLALGIPESRIIQSNFVNQYGPVFESNVSPDPNFNMPVKKLPANLTTVTNLSIELDSLKNIKKVYEVINASPNAKIINTSYSLNKRVVYESQARGIALEDARRQVESIAKINKFWRIKLVSIQASNLPGPIPLYQKGLMMEGASQSVTSSNTTSYAEQTTKISVSYTAVYEIN